MSQLNLRRFADVDFLKTIGPNRLQQLLSPHEVFFVEQGVMLDYLEGATGMERLSRILLGSPEAVPPELLDALYSIREMSSTQAFDILLAELNARNIRMTLEDSITPADLVVLVWLEHREVIEHLLWQVKSSRVRSLLVSEGSGKPENFLAPDAGKLKELSQVLEDRLIPLGKGEGCRVQATQANGVWTFQVRRSDPTRRVACLKEKGAVSTSIVFKPEVHDLLVYDARRDELSLNSTLKSVREAYLHVFGEILFGDADYFHWSNKYTLEPLRQNGAQSLACGDVPGIKEIRLTELLLGFDAGGPHACFTTLMAVDVFAAFEGRGEVISPEAEILRAKFRIRFQGRSAPRMMTIFPPFKATFTRDHDAQFAEDWMLRRGFLTQVTMKKDQAHVAIS